MRKIILFCISIVLILSFNGPSFAGSGNKHKKEKGHTKEYCKTYKKKNGPPPHAPAHGYRHKHSDGVELKFNANRGIYAVIDYDDYYFHGDNFFRIIDGAWKKSKHISGPWLPTPSDIIPPGLPPLPPPPPPKSFWKFF